MFQFFNLKPISMEWHHVRRSILVVISVKKINSTNEQYRICLNRQILKTNLNTNIYKDY